MNMSARRVVAMAAIISDAHNGRQTINDTCDPTFEPVPAIPATKTGKTDTTFPPRDPAPTRPAPTCGPTGHSGLPGCPGWA
jgi:hypothetical protein